MLRTACVSALLSASVAMAQGWVDRTPANPLLGPSNRAFAAMCWDQAHGYVLMCGGHAQQYGTAQGTWSWNGTAWTQQSTGGGLAPNNGSQNPSSMAMTFHPPTNEVVLVAGGGTFTWTGTSWLTRPGSIGSGPWGPPGNVALGHDPVHNQTVLFVGSRFGGGSRTDVAETYAWDGFGWSQRPTSTLPYPLDYPAMAFDPVVGRLLLCTTGNGMSACFEWTGTNWQQRLLAGAPAAGGAMATHAQGQRIVMLDGVMNSQPNHTWTIANGNLAQVSSAIEPARRFGAAMAYDPLRNRIVLFGGNNNAWGGQFISTLGDTWEFELGADPSYTTYGAGCAGSRGVPTLAAQNGSLPRVGQTFQVNLGNLPFTGAVFLFVGISNTTYGPTPLPFALGGLGAPGCSALASGEDLRLLTNVLGSALWQWTIPNAPGVSFYNQAFVFDPAANALGLTVSNGGHGTIGF